MDSVSKTINQANHAMFIVLKMVSRAPRLYARLNIGDAKVVDNSTFSASHRVIIGNGNTISSENCIVVGNKNNVIGPNNAVYGRKCTTGGLNSCCVSADVTKASSVTSDRIFGKVPSVQTSVSHNSVLTISSSSKPCRKRSATTSEILRNVSPESGKDKKKRDIAVSKSSDASSSSSKKKDGGGDHKPKRNRSKE